MIEIYKALNKQSFEFGTYKIVPIRAKDRYDIMKWRNDQLYHLRQQQLLTKENQDQYFEKVIAKLFETETPDQILFSYLLNEKCIGYGGLVHINWVDRNAEVSFVMDTALETNFFEFHWQTFLTLLEKVAFEELLLNKIFTWAFDIRSHLYPVLLSCGFLEEARLKKHCKIEGHYYDVLIHSKFNNLMTLKQVTEAELEITFRWATDKTIRRFSFSGDEITFEDHKNWFLQKVADPNCIYLLLEHSNRPIGTIRFDIKDDTANISYLVDTQFHGMSFGTKLLKFGEFFLKERRNNISFLTGTVMHDNLASLRLFEKLGYFKAEETLNSVSFKKSI